jgi:hypothetical protein
MIRRFLLSIPFSALLLALLPVGRAQVRGDTSAANLAAADTNSAPLSDTFGTAGADTPPPSSGGSFFSRWFSMVGSTQAEQPHWITPVVTATPRLKHRSRQVQPNGTTFLENYGGSKSLGLIPARHIELIFNPPPYIVRNGVPTATAMSLFC